jgi:type II secretory pathway pseudopilin PulG
MHLGGQYGQRGYAMAALLVSIGVMMLLMSVAMPVWRHEAQREKEAELIFRGEQYARAINLFQRKLGPGSFPPSVDVLVQQRFLRKKYKDPITEGDFQLIAVAGGIPQVPGLPPQRGGGRGRGSSTGLSQPPQGRSGMQQQQAQQPPRPFGSQGRQGSVPGGSQFGEGGQTGGGIMGVVSKSKETSIRVYHGATHYNEWTFLFSNVSNRPGAPAGAGAPGIPGGQRGSGGRGTRGSPGGLSAPGMSNPGGLGRPSGGQPAPGGAGSGRGPGGR